jgi:elongator complex protein 1
LYGIPALVVDVILPGALDNREKLSEEASEIKDQVAKQVARLNELRDKRLSDASE